MMEVTLTCEECGSGVHLEPSLETKVGECEVCHHKHDVAFNDKHVEGYLESCPCCGRKDFYKQKDFNRKIGVILFVIAAITSIWTYGISFIVLYVFDFILHRYLPEIGICYKCNTIFRRVANIADLHGFNHEMNDRIIYADHDFQGEQLEH
jgi:hypothetical protein